MKRKIEVPQFLISVRPSEKVELEDFSGRISLMDMKFSEMAYLEFSKNKKEASIYIDYINVESKYRRMEFGRMMVLILESLARRFRIFHIYSNTVSDEGEILMKKCGYKKSKRDGNYHKKFGNKKTY